MRHSRFVVFVLFVLCTYFAFSQEAVDLGLSVKWATCNVGATKPEESENYYAWGEIVIKEIYNWSTYKYCKGDSYEITKYCTGSSYGTVDNKKTLEKSDDVAYQTLGGNWRMPTDAEWTELREKCKWTWTQKNGVKGYEVEASNGNFIFLPAVGYRYDDFEDDDSNPEDVDSYGYYWSSSLNENDSHNAWGVYFASYYVVRGDDTRDSGQSVRLVQDVE